MAFPCRLGFWYLQPSLFRLRRGAQGQPDQAARLSERSKFTLDSGWTEQRRGRRQRGRLFFAYFLLVRPKKVSGHRASPGLLANHPSFEAPTGLTGINKC